MDDRPDPFFRGTELPRLALLAVIMIAGWAAVWYFAGHKPALKEPPLRAEAQPPPVEPDPAIEFETVTDRTPMSFRDNAAYAHLLEKARDQTPEELAKKSRRDVFGSHLWERPELYRGVPVHIQGSALRVVRFESKLSKTGWLYEAWIITPDARRFFYDCVFEDAPEGLPIGVDVSERVVFNGYFLKLMKYQAGDVARGAPVLIGKIGWTPRPASEPARESNQILRWSLVAIALMFVISMGRWIYQLTRHLSVPRRRSIDRPAIADDIPPEDLQAWVDSQGADDHVDDPEDH